MSPEQCRSARAWLKWSQRDLAARARVSASTIRTFEAGARVPHPNNLRAIRQVLEGEGIVFTAEGGIAPKAKGR
jgi:ribosome-binding protein aMBF1 (putative translation factor)